MWIPVFPPVHRPFVTRDPVALSSVSPMGILEGFKPLTFLYQALTMKMPVEAYVDGLPKFDGDATECPSF